MFLDVYFTNLVTFSCSSVSPVRYLIEVFKCTWPVTKCTHSSFILNHMQPYSKQVNTSVHTIFHSHALLLPESTKYGCIRTLKCWIPGPGLLKPFCTHTPKTIPYAMYNLWSTWECPIPWTINILSLSISLSLSLANISLLIFSAEKYFCALTH